MQYEFVLASAVTPPYDTAACELGQQLEERGTMDAKAVLAMIKEKDVKFVDFVSPILAASGSTPRAWLRPPMKAPSSTA
jgi:hypothetical protein